MTVIFSGSNNLNMMNSAINNQLYVEIAILRDGNEYTTTEV
jgi:hypothetical protein